jgi:hypothetical protein
MKWPAELLLIRHAESAHNSLRKQKNDDPDYRRFLTLLEYDPSHPELQPLAVLLHKKHALGYSDRDTPITPAGEAQARTTGREMRENSWKIRGQTEIPPKEIPDRKENALAHSPTCIPGSPER